MDTRPGVLPAAQKLQPLGPISPSRFVAMQRCALREVWAASHAPPLLPTAPAARLGGVVHQLLEEAGQGSFAAVGRKAVEARWHELVEASERTAARSWLDRHLVPLSSAIPDFEVRKMRALAGAVAITKSASVKPVRRQFENQQVHGYELAVATPDGQVAGRIDAVIASEHGPVIRDYKSGAIYDVPARGARSLREAHSSQLKLYAAIYASVAGIWPARLELVPVGGEPENVEFTVDECMSLLSTALQLRERINGIVVSLTSEAKRTAELATPTPATCEYCPYRPVCTPYSDAVTAGEGSGWPDDVRGELSAVGPLHNGRLIVSLKAARGTVRIRGLDSDPRRHPALSETTPGDVMTAFNLRPAGGPLSFSEGSFSVLYKLPGATPVRE